MAFGGTGGFDYSPVSLPLNPNLDIIDRKKQAGKNKS